MLEEKNKDPVAAIGIFKIAGEKKKTMSKTSFRPDLHGSGENAIIKIQLDSSRS